MVTTDRHLIERRQHVVRFVHQPHALARQRQRECWNCSAIEYVGAVSGTIRKFWPSTSPELDVIGPAQHHVLGVAIEPRQLDQDVADVRADAEVAELARVDGNPHPRQPLPVTLR